MQSLLSPFISPDSFWQPTLSLFWERAFVNSSLVLQALFFIFILLPGWRRYFLSEAHGGYAEKSGLTGLIHQPVLAYSLLPVWLLLLAGVAFDVAPVLCAGLNLILSHYFFIGLRWKTLARGMGAPGFMTYWNAAAIFLLELANHYAPSLKSLALLTLQFDFAIIMLSSGIYKATSGYITGDGFELGLVNPMWSHWWKPMMRLAPSGIVVFLLNQGAWSTEILSAILMLIPATRMLGGMLIIAVFMFIFTQIRLGVLTLQVMAGGLLFFFAGSPAQSAEVVASGSPWVALLGYAMLMYIFLRPIALLGLYVNFYAKKRFPALLQSALERYTNFFGIILWRVFTVDVVNFYVEVFALQNGQEKKISAYDNLGDWRYNQVTESIAVTSIFTSLKYYPTQRKIFEERLLRYTKTLPQSSARDVEFAYRFYAITKDGNRFQHVLAAEYRVASGSDQITYLVYRPELAPGQTLSFNSAHECAVPGSYAPGVSAR